MQTATSLRALLRAGLLLAPVLTHASAFSFGDNWSISANPQGGYSYGYAANTTDPLTLFNEGFVSQPGIEEAWRTVGVSLPVLVKNITDSDMMPGTALLRAAPSRFLNVHPGFGGEYAVISYALPTSGTLAFTADFAGHDILGTTTDVHVILDGVELFAGSISGIGSTLSYATPVGGLAVTAGDKLEVRVGYGNGSNYADSTGVKVEGSLTAVPEPTHCAAAVGMALIAFGVWRRR